jgi:hypothetical protein
MDDSEKLFELRVLTDVDDEDFVLLSYLNLAARKILNRLYPYRNDVDGLQVPKRYEGLQLEIAAYLMQKRGAEGEIQHIENGIHRNYRDPDVSDDMLSEIVPLVGTFGE